MAYGNKDLLTGQVQSELVELSLSEGLPFQVLLSRERIQAALDRAGIKFRERIYTPMVGFAVASSGSECLV